MPVGYVHEPGATVHLRDGSLHVEKEGTRLAEWELVRLDALCLCTVAHITQPALRAILQAGLEVTLLAGDGKLLGRVVPLESRNAELRIEQYRCYLAPERRLGLARDLLLAKLANSRANLLRYARNHRVPQVAAAAEELAAAASALRAAATLPSLLGAEGNAARIYFAALPHMCRGELRFEGRSTRPPQDPVNALLSLGYTFLVNQLVSAVAAVGFDPAIGFLHEVASGQPGLALDLAEPLRTGLIDRFVLFLVNNRVFGPADFESRDGGCFLTRSAFAGFVRQFHRLLERRRRHPPTGRRETYRRHLQLQAEHYANVLRHGALPEWFTIEGG